MKIAKPRKARKQKRTLDYRLFERNELELSRNKEYKHLMFVSKQLNVSI